MDTVLTSHDDIHLMPMDDAVEHEDSEFCVCEPEVDPLNEWEIVEGNADKVIWVHRYIRAVIQ